MNMQGYSLVGSNALRFSGTALLNGVTEIPGQSSMGYFSFNHRVDENDQIHFAPGDVVGWLMPASGTETRELLSLLYIHVSELDNSESSNAVTLHVFNAQQESCTVCDIESVEEGGQIIVPGVIPLMAPIVGKHKI